MAHTPTPTRGSWHRILVVAGFVLAGLLLVGAGWALRGALDDDVRPSAEDEEFLDDLDEDLDAPLIEGEQHDVESVITILEACGCPLPAEEGPMASEHVSEAWANDLGEILLIYDNGVEIYYTPEELSEEEFIEQEREDLEDPEFGFSGAIVDVRRTQAAAYDTDEEGPALLIWKEGDAAAEMYGEGGQSAAELIAFAETLRYSRDP